MQNNKIQVFKNLLWWSLQGKISKNLFRFDNNEIIVFYDHTDNFLLIKSTLPENKIDIIKEYNYKLVTENFNSKKISKQILEIYAS